MRKLSIINTQQQPESPSGLRASFVQTNTTMEALLCSPRLWQQANNNLDRHANQPLMLALLPRIALRLESFSWEQRLSAFMALAMHVMLAFAIWAALHSRKPSEPVTIEPIMVDIVPLLTQPNVNSKPNLDNKPKMDPKPELPKPKLITPPPSTTQVTKPRAEKIATYTEHTPIESAPKEVTDDATHQSLPPINPAKSATEVNHDVKGDVSDKPMAEAKEPSNAQQKPTQQKPAAEETVQAPQYGVAYLNNPKPVYPNLSRRAKEQGESVLLVVVDATGTPEKVEVFTSSGYERLDEAAVTAVKQWRFVPAKKAGQSVKAAVHVPIRFSLDS